MLTEPIGPLPMWVWLVGGAAGYWLFTKYRGGDGAATTLLSPAAGPAVNEEGIGDPLDNDSWGESAIASLVNAGYDPFEATTALGTYLDGGTLDPKQSALVSAALRQSGLPPELLGGLGSPAPVMPTPTQPPAKPSSGTQTPASNKPSTPSQKDTPKPKQTSSAYTTYKIKSGDTLGGIAKRNGTTVSVLAKLNKISDPNKIFAGNTIKIPK